MILPDTGTLLVIYELGIPLYSARGLIQTLELIGASANIVRDANGEPMDLSYAPFRKYASKISCTDQATPAFDSVYPGRILTIDCVYELAFLTASGSGPWRPVVSGSLRSEGLFTIYRPTLTMMIMTPPPGQVDEWNAEYQWSLYLEEV